MNDVSALLHRRRVEVDAELRRQVGIAELLLARMVTYHLGWVDAQGNPAEVETGKRLRPIFCLLACEAVGGNRSVALPLAAGVELLHNFSLVHDDIQDRSPQRHGRPTIWKLWGIAQAINAGDALFALAHRALAGLPAQGVSADVALQALAALDATTIRLCAGQTMDLDFQHRTTVTVDDYLAMAAGKTGALLGYALGAGALVGGASAPIIQAFTQAGESLGVAFQIRDDILGIWGDPARTGKLTGEDLREGKRALPAVYALQSGAPEARPFLKLLRDARRSPTAVSGAIAILDEIGARDYCQELAERYERTGLELLAGVQVAESSADSMAELRQLAEFVARREF
ncbi:MAG: polyprenyl synthetase family protein [Chloroflexi bacterium]|nr:polyprenyl synthetase family protein [Chloroflexota bacterium]